MESIEKNIDKYIDYLKYEKKLSNNTISSYYENLKKSVRNLNKTFKKNQKDIEKNRKDS